MKIYYKRTKIYKRQINYNLPDKVITFRRRIETYLFGFKINSKVQKCYIIENKDKLFIDNKEVTGHLKDIIMFEFKKPKSEY